MRLTNEVLVPLTEAYNCHENYWPKEEHRSSVADKYLEAANVNKAKVVGDALLPHEIIRNVHHRNVRKVADLQWMAMVEDIKKQSKKWQEDTQQLLGCM